MGERVRREQFVREYPLRRAAAGNLIVWSALVAVFVLLLVRRFLIDLNRGYSPVWVVLVGLVIFTIYLTLLGQIYLPPMANYNALWNDGIEFFVREHVVFVPYESVVYVGPKPDPDRMRELLHEYHAMAPEGPAMAPPGHRLVGWILIYKGEKLGHSVLFYPTSAFVDQLRGLIESAGGQIGYYSAGMNLEWETSPED